MKEEQDLKKRYAVITEVDDGGLRRYQDIDGRWGFCLPDGKPVTPPMFRSIEKYGETENGEGWRVACCDNCEYTVTPQILVHGQMAYEDVRETLTTMFDSAQTAVAV